MNLAELYYVGKLLQECATSGMQVGGETPTLTTAETVVAETVHALGPSAIGVISRRTGYAQSRVSSVVSVLHARGWLTVQTDPRDRRRTIVALTDLALEEAQRISGQDARPALEARLPDATHEQLDTLMETATSLLHLLEPESSSSITR